jgi:hypothetical protein
VGVDSLRAVELRNALGRFFSRAFPSTLMFDHPTVESLARYLASEDAGLRAAVPRAEEAPPPAPRDSTAGLLDRLAQLSDEEAAALAASLASGADR